MRRRSTRLLSGSRIVFFDEFVDPENTPLPQHSPNSGGAWSTVGPLSTSDPGQVGGIIDESNRLREQSAGFATALKLAKRGRLRRNGSVSADVVKIGVVADAAFVGVAANVGIGGREYVLLRQNHTAANWSILRRTWDQSEVAIASASQALTVDQLYRARLEIRKGVALAWIDGVLTIRTDTVIPHRYPGWGFRISNNVASAPQNRLDNWMTTR